MIRTSGGNILQKGVGGNEECRNPANEVPRIKPLARRTFQGYYKLVKVIAIQEAEGQLAGLIAEACRGEEIVLTDGFNRAKLVSEALDLNPKNYDRH